MQKTGKGKKFNIQCYKHNGKVHRFWDEAILLEETKDYMVFGNNKTTVIEAQGNYWKTKEPAIMYFFKDEWFNVIAQMKKDGIYYYCNIASPFIIEDDTIKYIDYDLDLRIFPSGEFKVLDMLEYQYHKKIMKYSTDLNHIIKKSMDDLITIYKNGDLIFDSVQNNNYLNLYRKTVTNA